MRGMLPLNVSGMGIGAVGKGNSQAKEQHPNSRGGGFNCGIFTYTASFGTGITTQIPLNVNNNYVLTIYGAPAASNAGVADHFCQQIFINVNNGVPTGCQGLTYSGSDGPSTPQSGNGAGVFTALEYPTAGGGVIQLRWGASSFPGTTVQIFATAAIPDDKFFSGWVESTYTGAAMSQVQLSVNMVISAYGVGISIAGPTTIGTTARANGSLSVVGALTSTQGNVSHGTAAAPFLFAVNGAEQTGVLMRQIARRCC